MARSRGSFGTVTRSIIDHERTLRTAAVILESEHGRVHRAGERKDLCPLCQKGERAAHTSAGEHG